MEKKDYAVFATNWWANQIKSYAEGTGKNMETFKQLLYAKICEITNKDASLLISTSSRDNLLEELAFKAGLLVNVPSGYEMRILLTHVAIYDSMGTLLESF